VGWGVEAGVGRRWAGPAVLRRLCPAAATAALARLAAAAPGRIATLFDEMDEVTAEVPPCNLPP
jgi:hypothetical protein